MGYREYPKYRLMQRYAWYKQALRAEATALLQAGVIEALEDVDNLTFDEFERAVRTGTVEAGLIDARRTEHARNVRRTPPRVVTSDGEILTGAYASRALPDGCLVGLGVSAGVVEGRARVLRELDGAELEAGDILVTPFTDPSWTPLFVAIGGLVTEVGGLMTHGAVIARE